MLDIVAHRFNIDGEEVVEPEAESDVEPLHPRELLEREPIGYQRSVLVSSPQQSCVVKRAEGEKPVIALMVVGHVNHRARRTRTNGTDRSVFNPPLRPVRAVFIEFVPW